MVERQWVRRCLRKTCLTTRGSNTVISRESRGMDVSSPFSLFFPFRVWCFPRNIRSITSHSLGGRRRRKKKKKKKQKKYLQITECNKPKGRGDDDHLMPMLPQEKNSPLVAGDMHHGLIRMPRTACSFLGRGNIWPYREKY
jgi:hypothetical protein